MKWMVSEGLETDSTAPAASLGCSLIAQCTDLSCLRLDLKAVSRPDAQDHTMKWMVSEGLETDSTAPAASLGCSLIVQCRDS